MRIASLKMMLASAVLLLLAGMVSTAQTSERRGSMALMEGRRYMVAFPQVWASPTEKPLPKPMMLLISSKTKAKVRIRTLAQINDAARIDRTIELKANEVYKFDVSTAYMNGVSSSGPESETRRGYGILVEGDRPISVLTYQAWMGNGELARHLPTEAWGKNYFTMNFYQDRYGTSAAGYKYRPAMFLIIADKDNTVVTFKPTATTEGGSDLPSTARGASSTITLERGETFVVKAKIDENANKEWTTDLSGSFITASKPVGVVSGHTKVAVMRYPDVLPPTGMYAAEAHFVRNNVHDAMLPVEMAGKQFITVPCQYTPTRVVGQGSVEFGIDDDRGDVVRIVALEDNTKVSSMRQDGSGLKPERTLAKGESFLATSVEVATLWQTDKPVLVGHYGKSYAKILPPALVGRKGEETPNGHPTVESGMPMLQYVPSVDRYATYGTFWAPEGMDNFMNIVFKTTEVGKIKVDGRSLTSAFGGSMRLLKGTDYAYIRTPIGAGNHVIESESESVKWAAWTYGSLDGLQQGRAYGTPVAIDLAIPCDDSLAVQEEIICGDVIGKGKILPENNTCGSIFAVYAEDLSNYELKLDDEFAAGDREVKFEVKVVDKTKDATARVLVITRSGKFVEKTYTYVADKIAFDPAKLDWGTVAFNARECKNVTLTNNTDKVVTVKDIKAKRFPGTFTFNPTSFVLQPRESKGVEVCASITTPEQKIDTILVALECFDMPATELRIRGEEPKIFVGEQSWTNVPAASAGIEKPVEIRNVGKVDVIITGYNTALLDKATSNFFEPRNLDDKLPIRLGPGEVHTWYVKYSPKGVAGVTHSLDVPFYTNAKGLDTIAQLTGIAVEQNTFATDKEWNERVIDAVVTAKNITTYEGVIEFGNLGTEGATFTSAPTIQNDKYGVFKVTPKTTDTQYPVQLVDGGKGRVTVTFTPTEIAGRAAERNDYTANVVFTMSDGKSVSGNLKATAWQPQSKGADYDFGEFNIGDAAKTQNIAISNDHFQGTANPTTGDMKGTNLVTITNIRIVGNANGFQIVNAPSAASPWILSGGEALPLDVRFTPTTAGEYVAQYEIISDAAYTPKYTLRAKVVGGGHTVSNENFEIWVNNSMTKTLNVRHDFPEVRRFRVAEPAGADADAYTIIEPANGYLDVAAGATGTIVVEFKPGSVSKLAAGQNLFTQFGQTISVPRVGQVDRVGRPFVATVDVIDETNPASTSTQTATLTGDGIYLETTNFVTRNYKVKPGESVKVYFEIKDLPQAVDASDLTEFRIRVSYDSTLIRPRLGVNGADIILAGTQLDGWSVVRWSKPVPNMVEIDFADMRGTKTPLRNNGNALFGLTFDAFLARGLDASKPFHSEIGTQLYWVDHDASNDDKNYAQFNPEPGLVVVDPQCARNLRLVGLSGKTFAARPAAPNPVTTSTVINYSIGLTGQTTIALYNAMGELVMNLVNDNLEAGDYELTVDASLLPAGTYYYQVVSGPFVSDPQPMTIVR
ncbi:MAG: choice-of-anchor D domain-containing protein [Candidatus Kapabacteria bacterium]|nr:choice-of-anchor D domain-containing protein [Candidatus Kapabacteria bacterium]